MIESYQELYETGRIKTEHLLIGNGFSIGIWRDFNYTSLYEKQQESLEIRDRMLFKQLNTTNFEVVLENIIKAVHINQIFNYEVYELLQSYERIKNALIQAVIKVHPENYELQLNSDIELNNTFKIFKKSIFTTNYDLIPYWLHIKLLKQQRVINDFFRNNGKLYLNFVPESINNSLNLYYLHGGLHLFVKGFTSISY